MNLMQKPIGFGLEYRHIVFRKQFSEVHSIAICEEAEFLLDLGVPTS